MFFSASTGTPTFILRTRDNVSGVNDAQNSLSRRDVNLRDGVEKAFVSGGSATPGSARAPRGLTYRTAEYRQRLLGCGFHDTNTSSGIPDSSTALLQHESCCASAEGAALAIVAAAATMASATDRRERA